MNHEFMEALDELEKDRGIDKEILYSYDTAYITCEERNDGNYKSASKDILVHS